MGFLNQEAKLLTDPGYQDKVALAVIQGVVRFLMEYGDATADYAVCRK